LAGDKGMSSLLGRRTATIEVSVAELIDRVTILRLKVARSARPSPPAFEEQLHRYLGELECLNVEGVTADLHRFLQRVNGMLWHLESEIRNCEAARDFGTRFICVSRMIRRLNDRRVRIKARIDELCRSEFRETKSYT
jgi:hypothetical protein